MKRVHPPFGRSGWFPLRLGGSLCIALLFLPTAALCQAPTQRIDDFVQSASGFLLLGTVHEETLSSGGSLRIIVTLVEGADYMAVGYCDTGCKNLDLALFDPDGNEIQADRLPDAEPILTHTAESSGRFSVLVDAVQCSPTGCQIAVGILGSTDEPGVSPGQDMGGRLTIMGMELMGLGFSEVERERRGALGAAQAFSIPLTLREGMEYRITGVCDKDCFDLDLALLDPRGIQVEADFLEDDIPILAHVPDTTAEYIMEVLMVACGVEPCEYRIATYAREADSGFDETTFSGELIFQETHHGELESDDPQLSGAHLDTYQVEARAGQRIILDLRSDAFDTLVRLLDPEGVGEENDDFGMEPGHSHLEFLALTSGTYSIQVTSFTEYSTGPYVLQIAVVE